MKKSINFKTWVAAALFILLCAVGVSVFLYSSAFAGGIPPSIDDGDNIFSEPSKTFVENNFVENNKAYAVVERNVNDGSINVTYLYDTLERIEKNYDGKNVIIYSLDSFYDVSYRSDCYSVAHTANIIWAKPDEDLDNEQLEKKEIIIWDRFRYWDNIQYTVDASFINYHPISGRRLFDSAKIIKGLQYLNTDNMQDMSFMFANSYSLESLDLSNFDTSNVTDMSAMFTECKSLKTLDLSSFNTSKVTDMNSIFLYCFSLESLDLKSFNTSKVTNMCKMFGQCCSLKALEISNFNTSNVTDMSFMFDHLESLESLDLSKFNTSKVTNMFRMFCWCQSLETLNLSKFDTSKVSDIELIFENCKSIKNLKLGKGFFNHFYSKINKKDISKDLIQSYASQLCKGSSAEKFIIAALK